MKVKEIIKACADAAFVEVFLGDHLHTDYCFSVDDYNEDAEAKYWELMDRKRYDETILANACVSADEIEDFDHGNALVILI